MNDYAFNSSDLNNGKLVVPGSVVGSFSIEDNEGKLVIASQKRIDNGVEVDFSNFCIVGNWQVRFFRGESGINTTGGINSREAMIYALIFG